MNRLILLCFSALVIACGSPNSETATESSDSEVIRLKKEVLAVHDTAMARMNDISKLQKELKSQATGEDSIPNMMAYNELQASRDAMMDWMREFALSEELTEQEQMDYLKGQLDHIKGVDSYMLIALDKGNSLIRKTK